MAAGQSLGDAQREILAEKQPPGEIAISIQIGLFANFLCFNGATQITARRSASMAVGSRG